MNKKAILAEVIKRIKRHDYSYQIKKMLESNGFSETEQDVMMAEAKEHIKNEKLKTLPKRNRLLFYTFVALTILSLVFFLVVVPTYNIYSSELFFSILASLVTVIFGALAFFYLHKTNPERIALEAEGKLQSSFTGYAILGIFPTVILVFLFIWRYTVTEDQILKETSVQTTGTVISGISTQSRRYSSTTAVIEFTTNDGRKMTVQEEINRSEFNNFYIGKKVKMIYSSRFPEIIELLTNANDIREFTNSEERSITPNDLMQISEGTFKLSKETLDKISFGWTFNESENVWINDNQEAYLSKRGMQVIYVTNIVNGHLFAEELKKTGFTRETTATETKDGQQRIKAINMMGGTGLYENEDYIIDIANQVRSSNIYITINLMRK